MILKSKKLQMLFWSIFVFWGYFIYFKKHTANILFWDQWDFLNPFFLQGSLWEIFSYQHSPHRQGLGNLFWYFTTPFTAWSGDGMLALVLFPLWLSCLLAILLKERLFGQLTTWDFLIPFLFIKLNMYESFVIVANPAHGVLPVLLLFAITILLTDLSYRNLLFILFLEFFSVYTGFGIFTVPIVCLYTVIEIFIRWQWNQNWKDTRLWILIILSPLIFSSFFFKYRFGEYASDCAQSSFYKLHQHFLFAIALLIHGIGPFIRSSIELWSWFLCFILIYFYLIRRNWKFLIENLSLMLRTPVFRSSFLLLGVLVLFSCLFALSSGFGRSCYGFGNSQSSRYVILTIPLWFATYAFFFSSTIQIRRIWKILIAIFLLIGSFYLSKGDWETFFHYSNGKKQWIECYFIKQSIAACDQELNFKIYPVPSATKLEQKIDFLKEKKLNLYRE